MSLELLHLGSNVQQETVNLYNLIVSALTLEPHTGDLWVSNKTNGKILRCPWSSGACEEVIYTGMYELRQLARLLVSKPSLYKILYV